MRAVCDTNVVVSALLFESSRCSWMREAWRTGNIISIIDASTATELLRVLEYPKFHLSPSDRDELLSEYLPFTEIVSLPAGSPQASGGQTPGDPGKTGNRAASDLRDPDDRIFLEPAVRSNADALITGDGDLLALVGAVPLEVLTPAQAREHQ